MNIPAVKFRGRGPDDPFLKSALEFVEPPDLERIKEREQPAAYVFPSQHLDSLRNCKDPIENRGIKNEAKGLSGYLLGRKSKKIPLIEGIYKDSRQLRRSVRTLLANAWSRGDRNIYLVGVAEKFFEDLWEKAVDPEAAQAAGAAGHRRKRGTRWGGFPDGASVSARELLRILGEEPEPEGLAQEYVGDSHEARLVRQLILRAAQRDCKVLILGPPGTGKEKVARATHQFSGRRNGRFQAINCGAISPHLLEGELFGVQGGFLPGVPKTKLGSWEVANKGTLFLDEIGDLMKDHQGKILRALEEGKITRIGGEGKEIEVDTRIIAATNLDLYSMVKSGQFRGDLYYRLCEFQIRTPALGEHLTDIPAIAQFLWREVITKNPKSTLREGILSELRSLRWAGNVRELKAILISLHSLGGGISPEVDDLRTAFLLRSYAMADPHEQGPAQKTRRRRMDCLDHLRRVEAVLGTWKVTVENILKEQKSNRRTVATIEDRLQFALSELEALCVQPTLFHSEATHSAVHQFRGKLGYFRDLLEQDRKEAFDYLKKDLVEAVNHTLAQVGKEIGLLRASAS